MKYGNYSSVKRISKATARKLFNDGKEILFLPCKLNPDQKFGGFGMWQNNVFLNGTLNFDSFCKTFASYCCTNKTGKYVSFYIKFNQ